MRLLIKIRRIERKQCENYQTKNQYGFRKQRSMREIISLFQVIIEKQIKRNKITYLSFPDSENPFDNVGMNTMFQTLQGT